MLRLGLKWSVKIDAYSLVLTTFVLVFLQYSIVSCFLHSFVPEFQKSTWLLKCLVPQPKKLNEQFTSSSCNDPQAHESHFHLIKRITYSSQNYPLYSEFSKGMLKILWPKRKMVWFSNFGLINTYLFINSP